MSMLFNVLAGQASASKLAFDSVTLQVTGVNATVTDDSLTIDSTTGFPPIAEVFTGNGNFGELSDRIGLYFKFKNYTIPELGASYSSYSGLCSADVPVPAFAVNAIVVVRNIGGVVDAYLEMIGDVLGTGEDNSEGILPPISFAIDVNTEFCIAYDGDQGANGTCYFYSSGNPDVPLMTYEFTQLHADPAEFMAYTFDVPDGSGITIIRNPSVEHAGVRNVGA